MSSNIVIYLLEDCCLNLGMCKSANRKQKAKKHQTKLQAKVVVYGRDVTEIQKSSQMLAFHVNV